MFVIIAGEADVAVQHARAAPPIGGLFGGLDELLGPNWVGGVLLRPIGRPAGDDFPFVNAKSS